MLAAKYVTVKKSKFLNEAAENIAFKTLLEENQHKKKHNKTFKV